MNIHPVHPNVFQTINTEFDQTHGHNIFITYIHNGPSYLITVTPEFTGLSDHDKLQILARVWKEHPAKTIHFATVDHKVVASMDRFLVTFRDSGTGRECVYTNSYRRNMI